MDFDRFLNECADPHMLERLFQVERYAWLALAQGLAAVIDIDGQFEDVNPSWERVTGHEPETLRNSYLLEYIHFEDREKALGTMQRLITSDIGSTSFSFRFMDTSGGHKLLNWEAIYSPDHNAYFCVANEVGDAASMEVLAFRDGLTGVRNRLALERDLPMVVDRARDRGDCVLIYFIDLDGFKEINDTLGHKAGDTLLARVAERLLACVGEEGSVYRMGGDEFIILLNRCNGTTHAESVAQDMVKRIGEPYVVGGRDVSVGASVGGACYPANAASVQDLVDKADKAMYEVKNSGKNGYRFHREAKCLKED